MESKRRLENLESFSLEAIDKNKVRGGWDETFITPHGDYDFGDGELTILTGVDQNGNRDIEPPTRKPYDPFNP